MILDNLPRFRELDSQDMCRFLDSLPDQIDAAWQLGQTLAFPASFKRVDRIVIAAMGSSALAGDMLAALVAESCNIPVLVYRSYELPAFADGQSTLVIVMSMSGANEESRSVLHLADARGTQTLVITANPDFAAQAEQHGAVVWLFNANAPSAPSRAVFGWFMGLLLALVNRMGLVRDLAADVADAVEMLRGRVSILGADGITPKNPAKRLAGQLIGRIPVIYGSGIMAPVARRWKTQLNENAKTWAQWDELPEVNHNATEGIIFPRALMTKLAVIILASAQHDHPRVIARQNLTKDQYLQQGISVDVVKMRGSSRLAQILGAVQYGDYVSYYVAMAYEVDPTPTPAINELRERLAATQNVEHDSHD